MNRWKVILVTLVIFGAGAVTGALLFHQLQGPPATGDAAQKSDAAAYWKMRHREFLGRMREHLDLSPEQATRVDAIFQESHERLKPIREQMDAEVKRVRSQILEVLNAGQREKFEKMIHYRGPRKKENRERDPPSDSSPKHDDNENAGSGDSVRKEEHGKDERRCCRTTDPISLPWPIWPM